MGSVTKTIKKIIPKEIRPVLPFAAAAFGQPYLAGLGGATGFAAANPLITKALLSGATSALTDTGNPLRTAALSIAPDILSQGLGSLGTALTPQTTEALKASISSGQIGSSSIPLTQQIGSLATKAAESDFLTSLTNPQSLMDYAKATAIPASVEAAATLAEINQDELDKYNRQLEAQGIKDRAARRTSIFNIYMNAGYDPEYVNNVLDKYGYASGGRVGYKEGELVTIPKDLVERLLDKKSKTDTSDLSSGIGNIMKGFEMATGRSLLDQAPQPTRIVPGFAFGGNVPSIRMKPERTEMAGSDRYLKLVEHFESLGYDYDTASALAYEAFKTGDYEITPADLKKGPGGKYAKGGIASITPSNLEMDYRRGGYVEKGKARKADDVDARLSKDEFVFTADAVDGAGIKLAGDKRKGPQVMYNLMNEFEAIA